MKISNLHELSAHSPEDHEEWKWLERDLSDSFEWLHISNSCFPRVETWLGKGVILRLLMTLYAVIIGRNSDLTITHGIHLAASYGFAKRMLGLKSRHIAWAFSIAEKDHISALKLWYYKFSLRDVDVFVMFSNAETSAYSKLFDLPQNRFQMLHWSSSKPEVDTQSSPPFNDGYIAAIGGEARDYATLFAVMRHIPEQQLVVVASPESVAGLKVPENVILLVNQPPAYTFRIMQFADFMVLPILPGNVSCGHSTIVFQYLLGKATITANSSTMEDYVKPGHTAETYEAGNVESLVDSIRKLMNDSEVVTQIAASGEQFAQVFCSEQTTLDFVNQYLGSVGLIDELFFDEDDELETSISL